jgi:hypothetical protein
VVEQAGEQSNRHAEDENNMRKSMRLAVVVVVLLFVASAAPRAGATTLAHLSLEQMARAADTVVRVRCVSVESRWDGGTIWTFNGFDVLEALKGAPPEHLVVRLPGGRVGHLVTNIEAVPRFQAGEEGFLFLEKTRAGDYSVTAWAEGTFRVSSDRPGTSATVTQDSFAFPVFDAGTRRFRTEGVRRLPVAEFREQIEAALAAAAAGPTR